MDKVDTKLIKMIENFKESVALKYSIVKLVLFGSMATGTAKESSDVDLIVVVKKYDKKLVEKLMFEWHEKHKMNYPVDFIQLSEVRFNKMSNGINIVGQALKEGFVI